MLANRPIAAEAAIAASSWTLGGPYEPDTVDISIATPIDEAWLVVIDPLIPDLAG